MTFQLIYVDFFIQIPIQKNQFLHLFDTALSHNTSMPLEF